MNEDERRERELAEQRTRISEEEKSHKGSNVGCLVFVVLFLFVSAVGAEFTTGLTWAIVLISIGIGIWVWISNMKKTESAVESAVDRVVEEQRVKRNSLNEMVRVAEGNGFTCSKAVVNMTNTSCLAIDYKSKKFLIKAETRGSSHRILPYNQLVSYELCKDGNSVISGNGESALMGGLLFGTTGAVVGAASSPRTIDSYCSEMYIAIVDSSAHRYKIPLITERVQESSYDYKIAIERARDMISILDVIDKYNKSLVQEAMLQSKKSDDSNLAKIKELKELLDMGAITQDEFNRMKKEYLNL